MVAGTGDGKHAVKTWLRLTGSVSERSPAVL